MRTTLNNRPRHQSRRRSGLSLIEVLVCLAVLAVLVSIGVPAVQSIRSASKRVECLSRLRQVGVALMNHVDRTGQFPIDGSNEWGFGVFLLADLGHSTLMESLRPDTSVREAGQTHEEISTVVSAFVCPLFDREATLENGTGRSSYRGSVWIFAEAMRRSDLYDGASQTLAIGETALPHAWAVPGVVDMQDPPGATGPLGSRHPGLTHFLFCDGSARALNDVLPPSVFAALSTPAGREPVGDF